MSTIILQSQDTIPNGNFENWNTNTSPLNWSTVNNLLPAGVFACNQTTNSYEGSYAMSMKTIDLGGMLVPAVATLGTVGMGFTEGGIPFTERPESLKGYVKHPSNGDVVMFFVQFYREGIEMGSGVWSTSDSIGAFTMFEAPITFASPLNPDTMNITMITDQNVMGSNMIIDALQFDYPPVNVEEVKNTSVKVYPNPCKNHLTITTENEINSIKILDLAGNVILENQHTYELVKLDIRHLPDGLYIVEIKSNNRLTHQKIIKRR